MLIMTEIIFCKGTHVGLELKPTRVFIFTILHFLHRWSAFKYNLERKRHVCQIFFFRIYKI